MNAVHEQDVLAVQLGSLHVYMYVHQSLQCTGTKLNLFQTTRIHFIAHNNIWNYSYRRSYYHHMKFLITKRCIVKGIFEHRLEWKLNQGPTLARTQHKQIKLWLGGTDDWPAVVSIELFKFVSLYDVLIIQCLHPFIV